MKVQVNSTRACTLMILCIALFNTAKAQFNKTYQYSINGVNEHVWSVDIVPDGNGNTLHLSTIVGTYDNLIITKYDFNGNVLWDEAFQLQDPGTIVPTKLIQTDRGNIIVTGMYTEAGETMPNPFAVRFRSNGAYEMMRVYKSNTINTLGSMNYSFTRANIVRAQGTGDESYIITAPGEGPLNWKMNTSVTPNRNYSDIVVNAIRIDFDLTPMWNKKYFIDESIVLRENWASPFNSVDIQTHWDYPSGLSHVYDNTIRADKYVICGNSIDYHVTPGGTGYDREYWFTIAIDNNGAPVTHNANRYRQLPSVPGGYGYTFGHDNYWDQNTGEVIMTHTIGNTNIAGSATSGASLTPASVINVAKFNQDDLNFTSSPPVSDYYFYQDATENYANGVFENEAIDGYVIGAWISDNTTHAGMPYPDDLNTNIALLEIDKLSKTINGYNRYNVFTEALTANIAYNHDPSTSTTNYVIAGTKQVSTDYDVRIISTDIGLSACGEQTYPTGYGTLSYNNQIGEYHDPFIAYDYYPVEDKELVGMTESTSATDCNNAPDPDRYKGTDVAQVSTGSKFKIYPSVLHNDNTVSLDINATYTTDVSAVVYSIDGRQVAKKNFEVNAGDNTLQWQLQLPQAGNYIIKLMSSDEALQGTSRITKY